MNELQIFENEEFGEVRAVLIRDKPYFVGIDIARLLGYRNPSKAVNNHCRSITKWDIPHPQSKTKYLEVNVIPKGDVYRLIINSELPSAEKFEKWVFDEVLPTIEKHGAYMTPEIIEKTLTDPDFIIQLATNLKEERKKRELAEQQIEQDKPLVLFANSVNASENSCLIGELAKLISQNGYQIGQNRLFSWLRDNKYLIKQKGENYNLPTQKSMELGVMEIKKRTVNNPDGSIRTTSTPKVTGKGQIYFINKFLKDMAN